MPVLKADKIEPHSGLRGAGSIRFVYLSAPDGVVVELTQHVGSPKLARQAVFVKIFDREVHGAHRALDKKRIVSG